MHTHIVNTPNWSSHLHTLSGTHTHTHTGAWWGHMVFTEPEAVSSYWVTVILTGRTKWSQLKSRSGGASAFCPTMWPSSTSWHFPPPSPPLLPRFLITQRPYLLASTDVALLIPVYTQGGKWTFATLKMWVRLAAFQGLLLHAIFLRKKKWRHWQLIFCGVTAAVTFLQSGLHLVWT